MRFRGMVVGVVVLLAACLGLLLLLEITARVHLFGLAGLDPRKVNSVHGLAQTGFLRRSSEPRLGFELKPGVDGHFQLARFRTNSVGMRDREYPREKPDDTFRVAVLGSSVSLPTGVAIEDAYHSVLEEELTRELAPRRVEFLNFSVGMYTAEQILAMLELRALDYEPDLVLIGVTSRQERWIRLDPGRRRRKRPPQQRIVFERTSPALQSFLWRFLRPTQQPGDDLFPVGVLERAYIDWLTPPDAPETDDRFVRMLPAPPFAFPPRGARDPAAPPRDAGSVLARLAALQRRTRIPIVLAGLEMQTQERWRHLERKALQANLVYCDTRQGFRDLDTKALRIHALDPHPDARGHGIFAREIGACLHREGLLPYPAARAASRPASAQRPPNVVLIVADDLGWRDTGVYGSRFYQTPHLDRLAGEGMRFTSAYTANPLCSPARASLLAGLDPARLRFTLPLSPRQRQIAQDPTVLRVAEPNRRAVEAQSRTQLPLPVHTLAESLRDVGFATAHFGKWHLGDAPYLPEQQGFDHVSPGGNFAFPSGYFSPYGIEGFPDGPEGEQLDERMAAEVVAFMRAHRDAPFFLNLWLYSVHVPLQTRPQLERKYRDRILPSDPQQNPIMGGMVETLDAGVGTVLAALDELGLRDETIVVFLSDNGGFHLQPRHSEPAATSNAPLRGGKGQLYEGGLRIPMMIRWPGRVTAGVANNEVVTTTDLYPTLLELAGITPPRDLRFDGISIAPALAGQPLEREAVFVHFPHYGLSDLSPPGTAVRRGDWKLIRFYAEGPGQTDRLELYDLRHDPGESRDVAAEHPERVAELAALIDAYLEATSALVPVPNPAWAEAEGARP